MIDKKLYYTLNFTWGIIMNIFGSIAFTFLKMLGYKPFKHAGSFVIKIGRNWGGLNLGVFCFVCENASKHTLDHEFGHSLQNAVYGPLFPFIVAIPSFTRYWTFEYKRSKKIPITEKYDDAWFEGQATAWGESTAKKW